METGVAAKGGQGGGAIFGRGGVEEGAADFGEVELEFFGEDVLDEGFDGDVVVAAYGG